MGMTDAFTGMADFSGMEQTRELYLGAVLHKAFIAVNEEGTEAAAATAVIMQTKSISFMTVDFIANHPFIFLIRDTKTGTLLFLGRMAQPQG
jgi:serpin B